MLTIKSPTHLAWMIARIETYDNEDGSTVVRDIQDLMDLRPLSAVGDSLYTAPKGVKNIANPLPPVKQMESLSVEEFMNQLNDLLITQQTASYDDDIINRFKNIGIQAGARFENQEKRGVYYFWVCSNGTPPLYFRSQPPWCLFTDSLPIFHFMCFGRC